MAQTTNFPNLGLVSNNKTEASPTRSRPERDSERRKMPRLTLAYEQFRLAENGKLFAVSDLSEGGMALRVIDREDLGILPVGRYVEGVLSLKGRRFEVSAQVRHIQGDLVGFRFEEFAPGAQDAIRRYIDPAFLGAELRPMPLTDSSAIWYHAPSGTDLVLWRGHDGQYHRMALCVLGSIVQWEVEAGLSTGRTDPARSQAAEERGLVQFETMVFEPDSAPDAAKLAVAKTLMVSSNLSEDLRKWCLRRLSL
jgi:hypothetical protein